MFFKFYKLTYSSSVVDEAAATAFAVRSFASGARAEPRPRPRPVCVLAEDGMSKDGIHMDPLKPGLKVG